MKASNIAGIIAAAVCLLLAAWYLLFDNGAPERPPYPGDEYAIRAMSEGASEHRFRGDSMGSVLNANHIAYSRPVPFEEVREGALVVFRKPNGEAVCHRAIGRNGDADIITKGDSLPYKDAAPVTRGNYIGVISEEEIFLRP